MLTGGYTCYETVFKMELECSTCLESFTASSHLLSTPCGHIFHNHCINEWLDKGDLNCPQCTAPITDFAELRRIYLPFITNNTSEEKVKTDLSDQKVTSKSKPESIKKEWHDTINASKRNDLVQKFAQALMPIWEKSEDLLTYAKKIENEYFENANSRQNYELKLAQKLLEKEKELTERNSKQNLQTVDLSCLLASDIPEGRGEDLQPATPYSRPYSSRRGNVITMSHPFDNQNWFAPDSRHRNTISRHNPYARNTLTCHPGFENWQNLSSTRFQTPVTSTSSFILPGSTPTSISFNLQNTLSVPQNTSQSSSTRIQTPVLSTPLGFLSNRPLSSSTRFQTPVTTAPTKSISSDLPSTLTMSQDTTQSSSTRDQTPVLSTPADFLSSWPLSSLRTPVTLTPTTDTSSQWPYPNTSFHNTQERGATRREVRPGASLARPSDSLFQPGANLALPDDNLFQPGASLVQPGASVVQSGSSSVNRRQV